MPDVSTNPSNSSQLRFQKVSFLLYLLAVTAAFLYILQKFLMPLVLAAVFTALTYPIYAWILGKVRKPAIAALLTLLSVLLVLVLPLIAVGATAYQEAMNVFHALQFDAMRERLDGLFQAVQSRYPSLFQRVNTDSLVQMASDGLKNGLQFVIKHSADISLSVANNLISFFLMLFIMFYFYLDGHRILARLIRWSPLKDEYEHILIDKFVSVSKGTLKGVLVIGLIQAILGGLLFWAVGLSSPIFLGSLMLFGSFIPAVGHAAIWLPTALVLLLQGRYIAASIVALGGGLVISSVDNFLRPVLVGKDIKMHDLLVLLSTLGGLSVFGLPGFILGPVIASLFLSIWNIFEEVFSDELSANAQTGYKTGKIAAQMREAPPPPATEPGKDEK
jgi:predicted PurR-regulated permease PerM